MNPCTLGWYLPLLVKDAPGALQPSDGHRDDALVTDPGHTLRHTAAATAEGPHPDGSTHEDSVSPGAVSWKDLDSKFRRDLPDDAYVGRMCYRGLVMRACPNIRLLDGVETSEKERDKAEKILKSIIGIKKKSASAIAGAKEKVAAAVSS